MWPDAVTRYYRRHRKAIQVVVTGVLYAGGWTLGYLTALETASAAVLILGAIVGGYDIARTAYYEAKTEDRYADIGRQISAEAYREVLAHAREIGLDRIEYDPRMVGESAGIFRR